VCPRCQCIPMPIQPSLCIQQSARLKERRRRHVRPVVAVCAKVADSLPHNRGKNINQPVSVKMRYVPNRLWLSISPCLPPSIGTGDTGASTIGTDARVLWCQLVAMDALRGDGLVVAPEGGRLCARRGVRVNCYVIHGF